MILLAAIYLAICGLATALAGVALLFESRGDRFVSRLGAGLLIGLEQIERYGPWGFTARYLWLLIRHGYEAHPMEIEAREISGHR